MPIAGHDRAAAACAAVAVILVALYATLQTRAGDRAWPLPLVLPAEVQFHGQRYAKDDQAGCKSLAEWSRIQQHTPIAAYRTIGHLPSAVHFFGPKMITPLRPDPTYHQYQWFIV